MELGEKLRQARMEAGLSQRELCGEIITRNMLSQIEHGTAGPSMGTLRYLASRLGKPVSYFLEETYASPNQPVMAAARACFDAGDYAGAVEALKSYRGPDEIFDREEALLLLLSRLNWAENLLATGRAPYAREILEKTDTAGSYCAGELEKRRLLLLGKVAPVVLPSLDGELLDRAELERKAGRADRAGKLLDAAEDQTSPRWHLLRGEAWFDQQAYREAANHLQAAEEAYPESTARKLEICFREMGDYRRAYEYARSLPHTREP